MKRLLLFCLAATAWQAAICQWSTNGNNIFNSNSGNIGINTSSPQAKLDMYYSGGGSDIFATFRSGVSGTTNILQLQENNYVGLWRLYSSMAGRGLYIYGNPNTTDAGGINLQVWNGAASNTGTWACVNIGGYSIGNTSSSGNFTFNNLSVTPAINNTTGTTLVRGFYYNPTLTATGGTLSNVAYENVSGNNLLNSTSGNTIVGVGTDNGNKLQVNGNLWTTGLVLLTGAGAGKVLTSDANGNATWQTGSGGGWGFSGNTVGAVKTFGTIDNYDLPIITNNTERMRITAGGALAIGTTNPYSYMLAVNGSAIFTAAWVKPYNNWPDYVFAGNYRLPSLDSVSSYIRANHHLADVPSAETVAKTGLNLGDNQAVLLKKIEELTLYLIDQDKTIQEYKEKFTEQEWLLKEQERQMQAYKEKFKAQDEQAKEYEQQLKAQKEQTKALEERIARLEKLVKQ